MQKGWQVFFVDLERKKKKQKHQKRSNLNPGFQMTFM